MQSFTLRKMRSNSSYWTGTTIILHLSEERSVLRTPESSETGARTVPFLPPCRFGVLDCHGALVKRRRASSSASVLVPLSCHSSAGFHFLSPIMQRADFPEAYGLWQAK